MASTGAQGPPTTPPATTPADVPSFWFAELDMENHVYPFNVWFGGGLEMDNAIREEFGAALDAAEAGQLDSWKGHAKGRLALVILLDQFTRNAFRDTARAFASDEVAQELSLDAINKDMDRGLGPFERVYLYMPLMHSEDIKVHDIAEDAFSGLCEEFSDDPELHKMLSTFLDFERKHRTVIERFGRYPTRNEILERENTPEEDEYMAEIKAGKQPW